MPNIPGTNVAAPIVPFTTEDTTHTTEDTFIKGGHHTVPTLVDRDQIIPQRRKEGMLCSVVANGVTYKLKGGIENVHWIEFTGSGTTRQFDVTADGIAPTLTVQHQLGRRNLQVSFLDITTIPHRVLMIDWEYVSDETIEIKPAVVLGNGRVIRVFIT